MTDHAHESRRAATRGAAALTVALLTMLTFLGLDAAPAAAHPLGNFTTNTSATILPGPDAVEVVYVLDLAEIPTQQTQRDIDAAGGAQTWAQQECVRIAGDQRLTVGGRELPLAADAAAISFPEGQAGLDTLRLTCALRTGALGAEGSVDLTYDDTATPDRIGWREVVAVGDSTTITTSDVPDVSTTEQLRTYPTVAISTVTTAALTVDLSGGDPAPASVRADDLVPVTEQPGGLEGLVDRYTTLVSRQTLTPGFVLLAFVLAIALGTAHAVAPGHGKTVIAAYLLGEGGQARQAVTLGGTVAITHTIGVLALGAIVQTSTTLAPESLYPILGVMGGVIFAGLGCLLLYRAVRNRGHDHGHDHDHGHSHHHGHDHEALVPAGLAAAEALTDHQSVHTAHEGHQHEGHAHEGHGHEGEGSHDHAPARPQNQGTWRMLILPGLAGGMVPSPSALLVLLGGIALDRTWFGVLLVLAYGIGMALALVGAGFLLHRVRFRVMDRLESDTWARVSVALPIVTSTLIIVGGFVIIGRSLLTA